MADEDGLDRVRVSISVPKKILTAFAIFMVFAIYAGSFIYFLSQVNQAFDVGKIFADGLIAYVATLKAGPPIPVDDIDYAHMNLYTLDDGYGTETNSLWLGDASRIIVPTLSYEGLTAVAKYPVFLVFVPMGDYESYHVLGRAHPDKGIIGINERALLFEGWQDKREIYATLVHELIHLQGGNFANGESSSLESYTSAGTIEVLAALCNYGEELACKAFWNEIAYYARASLMVRMGRLGFGEAFQSFADLALRTPVEERKSRKSNRFWEDKADDRMVLLEKYALHPYTNHVIGGLNGRIMSTGNIGIGGSYLTGEVEVIGMRFDDTWDLLGFWGNVIRMFYPPEW